MWPTLFLLLIYFLSLDLLSIDLDLLKVLCVLTDQFTRQRRLICEISLLSLLSFFHIFLMPLTSSCESFHVAV